MLLGRGGAAEGVSPAACGLGERSAACDDEVRCRGPQLSPMRAQQSGSHWMEIESGRPFAGSAAVPGGTGTRQRGFCLISFGNAYIISGKDVNRQWKIRDGFIKIP